MVNWSVSGPGSMAATRAAVPGGGLPTGVIAELLSSRSGWLRSRSLLPRRGVFDEAGATRMQTNHPIQPSPTRWLRRTGLVLYAVRMGLSMSGAAAVAKPPPAAPPPGAAPAPSAPVEPAPAAGR